jgi:hypothetical protein
VKEIRAKRAPTPDHPLRSGLRISVVIGLELAKRAMVCKLNVPGGIPPHTPGLTWLEPSYECCNWFSLQLAK